MQRLQPRRQLATEPEERRGLGKLLQLELEQRRARDGRLLQLWDATERQPPQLGVGDGRPPQLVAGRQIELGERRAALGECGQRCLRARLAATHAQRA